MVLKGSSGSQENEKNDSKFLGTSVLKWTLGFALFGVLVTTGFLMSSKEKIPVATGPSASGGALFDDNGRYVMNDFDEWKPMSNFLAGIGGLWGVPMVGKA
jgi:hypothetical protein